MPVGEIVEEEGGPDVSPATAFAMSFDTAGETSGRRSRKRNVREIPLVAAQHRRFSEHT